MVKIIIGSLFGNMFSNLSKRDFFSRPSGERPAKDEIIDVRVVNGGEIEEENER